MKADWVSLKIDAADYETWHRVDRPHGYLTWDKIMTGSLDLPRPKGVMTNNAGKRVYDKTECIDQIGKHIGKLKPSKAYESGVQRPLTQELKEAFKIFVSQLMLMLSITGDEEKAFLRR